MNEMSWEKEESREGKVRDRRTPCLHSRGVGEVLGGGSEEQNQDRRGLEDDWLLEVVKGGGMEAH